ncbi:GNAT family N-acetyltransferase [Hephaestia sp. GCM10023244]|uniref:GNAT family N-acetyltransferase n=1 Tax=unclassified Hephaestia TaxID=2631281 RepID=UPI0020772925|nr:GNAT family N-acetyltransferase [Hephaestia sp. MAHUQ-44]MCM8732232.1 GNAT family N-acetyltransferase [Hephaestia sp. MAHUQ-44]
MIVYRDALPADGPELARMAARSFTETFGTLYRASDLAAFLGAAFGDEGLPSQIDAPGYAIRLATEDGKIIGFAKLGPVDFPGDWPAAAISLHQLYVLGGWHGEGVGPALMVWAIAHARRAGHSDMILSVYVDNHRARRFYERYGFVEVGAYTFMVGDHQDDDHIMRLAL